MMKLQMRKEMQEKQVFIWKRHKGVHDNNKYIYICSISRPHCYCREMLLDPELIVEFLMYQGGIQSHGLVMFNHTTSTSPDLHPLRLLKLFMPGHRKQTHVSYSSTGSSDMRQEGTDTTSSLFIDSCEHPAWFFFSDVRLPANVTLERLDSPARESRSFWATLTVVYFFVARCWLLTLTSIQPKQAALCSVIQLLWNDERVSTDGKTDVVFTIAADGE